MGADLILRGGQLPDREGPVDIVIVAAGCRADLVAWECEHPQEVVATRPPRTLVVKRGRITVQYERRVVERWREAT